MSKLKNSKKRHKKGNKSYMGSQIVTKMAQNIDLVDAEQPSILSEF